MTTLSWVLKFFFFNLFFLIIFTCATIFLSNGLSIGVAFPKVHFGKSEETMELEISFDNLWS